MDKRLKAVTDHNGEVVFVGTHMQCSQWIIENYPEASLNRQPNRMYNVLPGVFRIQVIGGKNNG